MKGWENFHVMQSMTNSTGLYQESHVENLARLPFLFFAEILISDFYWPQQATQFNGFSNSSSHNTVSNFNKQAGGHHNMVRLLADWLNKSHEPIYPEVSLPAELPALSQRITQCSELTCFIIENV